ncbi:hypothetical protein U1Q18_008118 [Sarracenia purpurea var. burkii]
MSKGNTSKTKKQRVSVRYLPSKFPQLTYLFQLGFTNIYDINGFSYFNNLQNKSQKTLNNVSQEKSSKIRRFLDSRSSLRQGVLAQKRSNFQGNQFPLATEAARKAAVVPIRNRAFNRGRGVNVNQPRYLV